ncbi:MAG: preprotein translocase subunit YajC [Pseudomonadota bacterium]|nr:preprotein translocase subunit YajC [Pseudomonadota bacterium]
MSLLPLVLIFVVFYFLLIRPQQKKAKEHREMLSKIRRKDKIVTNGGLMGTVSKVGEGDDILKVEIAEGVVVEVRRGMVAEVVSRSEPVND